MVLVKFVRVFYVIQFIFLIVGIQIFDLSIFTNYYSIELLSITLEPNSVNKIVYTACLH